jgi:hypothetical protein
MWVEEAQWSDLKRTWLSDAVASVFGAMSDGGGNTKRQVVLCTLD